MKNATVVDLFCGIGGLSLGASRAGFNVSLAVDIDPTLLGIHERNFPTYAHKLGDVSGITGAEVRRYVSPKAGAFGIVGGPPCQGFSRIGKRDTGDHRNNLFAQFFRIVEEANPDFFVAENVPGILDSQYESLVEEGLRQVRTSYTLLDPFVLNAADFGAATFRERILFIGFKRTKVRRLTREDFTDAQWRDKTLVRTALSGLPSSPEAEKGTTWGLSEAVGSGKYWSRIRGHRPKGVGDPSTIETLRRGLVSGCIGTNHSAEVEHRFNSVTPGKVEQISRMPRLDPEGFCPTLRAGTGRDKGSFQALRPIHFAEPRVITPREAARLQGFPDWFRLHDTKWHSFRGIGNSVSPLLAESVLSVIRSKLRP